MERAEVYENRNRTDRPNGVCAITLLYLPCTLLSPCRFCCYCCCCCFFSSRMYGSVIGWHELERIAQCTHNYKHTHTLTQSTADTSKDLTACSPLVCALKFQNNKTHTHTRLTLTLVQATTTTTPHLMTFSTCLIYNIGHIPLFIYLCTYVCIYTLDGSYTSEKNIYGLCARICVANISIYLVFCAKNFGEAFFPFYFCRGSFFHHSHSFTVPVLRTAV